VQSFIGIKFSGEETGEYSGCYASYFWTVSYPHHEEVQTTIYDCHYCPVGSLYTDKHQFCESSQKWLNFSDFWPWKLFSYCMNKKTAHNLKTAGQSLMNFCMVIFDSSLSQIKVGMFDLWPWQSKLMAICRCVLFSDDT